MPEPDAPELDERNLRSLLILASRDVALAPGTAQRVIRRQRRRQARVRVAGVAGTAAAAGLAAGILVPAAGGPRPPARPAALPAAQPPTARPSPARDSLPPHPTASSSPAGLGGAGAPATELATAQRALAHLSEAAAASAPRPGGRYVILAEHAVTIEPNGGSNPPVKYIGGTTNVIDTQTGADVEYQDITVTGGDPDGDDVPPRVLTGPAGTTPTSAQLDAMPTAAAALRAALLAQGKKDDQSAGQTADDLVFEEATQLLWQPHVGPALRAALYRVLAATPGVDVRTGVRDSSGRPATEISRFDAGIDETPETFEDPATGTTLESAWDGPYGTFSEDLYQSVRFAGVIPPDPYK
ncbi:MAG TPA: hypothetical protein VH478_05865 [Trebonia sp.]|jgi:hypothetical protein|nr:hypothetical protein [Trebonia sp.]